MSNKRKALIIGSGVAGPAMAMFLQRTGIDVEVYEARNEADEYAGVFLNVSSNGLEVLRTLGLDQAISAEGFAMPRMIMWSGSGKRLGEVRNGAAPGEGITSVTIKRRTLHKVIREGALREEIKINFGKKLQDIEVTDEQKVIAIFEDGTRATGDLLIGSDGIHSRTRRIIAPPSPKPVYTGLISTGGFSHSSTLRPTTDTQHFIFGKYAFFGYLVKPSGEIYWFNNYGMEREPERGELETMSSDELKQKLLAMHSEDIPVINEIIQGMTGEITQYPLYDIPYQPFWYKTPIVLIGDAAHATTPSAGQGASLALEDTIVLAKCLRDIADLEQAFATFEQLRRERAEKVVDSSRKIGANKAVSNPVGRWFRDLMMPFFLKLFANNASLSWIYTYKVDWDERVQPGTSPVK